MRTLDFKPGQGQFALNLVLSISALVTLSLLSPTMAQTGPAPAVNIQLSSVRATPTAALAWTALPGAGKDIGAGGGNGTVWVVSTGILPNGFNVFRWVNNAWLAVPSSGAERLDVDPQGNAWVVDNQGTVQRHDGTKWVTVAGIAASDIGVGADGTVWVIGSAPIDAGGFGIYRANGITWTQMPGAAVRRR